MGLTIKEMEELHEDIKMHLDLAGQGQCMYSTGRHLQCLEKPLEVGDSERELSPKPGEKDVDHDRKEPTLHEETPEVDEEVGSYSPVVIHGNDNEEAIDPKDDKSRLDNFKNVALKTIRAMEESDAIFGSNSEINLDAQLDLHAGDSRAGRPASDVEEDDERQQALEAIKSSRNAEKKLVTSRFSSFPRGDIFPA
ncbi:hypothetical protein ACH5RR_015499 [Cinchona calisaya]|uniref:Uncharacterized protein n=1 Tax=Cinchona calisaya TaxID=153742 RepID=A0ABD2ZTA1_9GENT